MSNNKNKLIIIFAFLVLFSIFYFLFSSPSKAAAPLKLQVEFPCPNFPGAKCPATPEKAAQSPAAYIARLYQFALMLSGMLAFGMIIFGAIQYTVSAGNTARQSDARDRITQALWGVALLLGAYLILYTIDPKLVSLTDPNVGIIGPFSGFGGGVTRGGGAGGGFGGGVAGDSCQTTADCSSGFECQSGKCALSEKRKQAQESGQYEWVDFGSYAGRANLCSSGQIYADNYCPGPKPNDNYSCCLK